MNLMILNVVDGVFGFEDNQFNNLVLLNTMSIIQKD